MKRTLGNGREESTGDACSRELVELISIKPYCKIKARADTGIAKRETASRSEAPHDHPRSFYLEKGDPRRPSLVKRMAITVMSLFNYYINH